MGGADETTGKTTDSALAFLAGGGTTGALLRAHDWAATPLGEPVTWPQPLKTLVGVMLTANQPMFVAWGPARTLLYNDAYAAILATKHPDALGRDFLDVWHEIRADLVPIVDEAYAGRPVHMDKIELVMHRRGYPEETHFSFSYTPVRDERGKVAGFFCPCQEITGQVEAERQLRQSEARLRGVLEGMGEAFGLLDRDFRILAFNEAALRLETRPLEEIVGRSHWEVYPGSEESEIGRVYKRALAEQQPVALDHCYTWEDGTSRWLEMRAHPVPEGLAVFWRDISERKKTEKALREGEARLRLALQAGQLAEVTFHLDGGVTHSAAFAELLGHPPETRLTLAEIRAQYHPEDHDRVVAERAAILAGDQAFYEVEKRIIRPDGQVRWIYGRGSVNRNPQGRAGSVTAVYLDDTDGKQTEIALRESEERFRAIVETATDYAIFTTDAEGRIETWPPGAQAVFGWSATEAIGQSVEMTFTPEDRTIGAPATERLTADTAGQSPNVRWHLRRDGSRVFIEGVTRPLRGEDGALTGFVVVGQDVTERRATEDALRASEARLAFLDRLGAETAVLADADAVLATTTRLLGEHMAVSLCAYADMDEDRDGFTIRGDWAAPGSKSIVGRYRLADFGRLAVERLGAGLPLVVNDNLRELAPEEAETFQAIGIAATICMPLVKDGRLAALMAIHDRRPRTWTEAELGLLREVTARSWAHVERVAATADLRDSEARLRAVLEATPVGLVFADTTGRIVGANARVEEIIGQAITGSDGVEHYRDDYVAFHADGRRVESHEYPLAQVVRGEAERAELEVQVALPDGLLRWVRYIATPVTDERGRSIGAVVASLDVDRERRLTENLAREVEAAVAEREEAQEQLRQSQKMEAMGSLTGGVAHDFNNLLTPILAVLDRLQRQGLGTERERRLIDGASQSAERAKTLVQRLLAFARRQPLQPGPVDVGRLVTGMADLIASTTGPRIEVRVDLAPDLPPARADAHQLEMALLNLAVNARDAMPEGGRLTIAAARDAVRGLNPAKLRVGHYVRLSVTDTGLGMDEATLARAVEPFFSTKGVGKGTGLGLSMVHGLAAQLGGGLTIESRPGRGTTVELWLPLSLVAVGADEPRRSAPTASAAKGTVLLVEDEDLVRMSTADMLMDLGYEVVEASSAEEALRLVDQGLAPDLVVTDHLMPGLTGVDLARDLLARRPDLPVLIVSGYADVEGIAPGLPRLTKPFRNAELAASLTALIAARV